MTVEVWLPIEGLDTAYEASNQGRIRRVGGACLKPVSSTGGYMVVTLPVGGVWRNHRVSRVVLTAFCGMPPFDGAHAAHNDGDNSNNALTNLRWATPVENQADIDRHGHRCRGESVFGAQLTEQDVRAIRRRCAAGERNKPIAQDHGVSISTVHLIRHNRTWRHVA
jgi:hypothetical protein